MLKSKLENMDKLQQNSPTLTLLKIHSAFLKLLQADGQIGEGNRLIFTTCG
jgi:hypothetical protein